MSVFNIYLELEETMLELEDRGLDDAAERLREAMDVLWHELDDDDLRMLNDREDKDWIE